MPALAFVAPLLPGKTEADRTVMASCSHGERKQAFEDARRRDPRSCVDPVDSRRRHGRRPHGSR